MRHLNPMRRFLLLALTAAMVFTLIVIPASAATYRQGDRGSAVTTIQTKLKNWGYYTGNVDGVFGSQTTTAVRYFQSKNGLTVDGGGQRHPAGPGHVLGHLGQRQRLLSAGQGHFCRGPGELYTGQVAVGAVILNRVEHPRSPTPFPVWSTSRGPSAACMTGRLMSPLRTPPIRRPGTPLNGADPTGGAIYYFNPVTATNGWIWSRPLITVIGNHRFCAVSTANFGIKRAPSGALFRCGIAGFALYYMRTSMDLEAYYRGIECTGRG